MCSHSWTIWRNVAPVYANAGAYGKLPNFLQGKEPQYQTEATSFYTTFYNLNWGDNGRIPVEEVANRVNSTLESTLKTKKFGGKFGGNSKVR